MKTAAPPPPCVALFWRIFAVLCALTGGGALAGHNDAGVAATCTGEQIDRRAFYPTAQGPDCATVGSGSDNNAPGDNRQGVVIYTWLDGLAATPVGHGDQFVVANRSNVETVYEGGADSRLFLQPRSDAAPTLFLRDLVGTLTVAANTQDAIMFTGVTGLGGSPGEVLYWSEPQTLAAMPVDDENGGGGGNPAPGGDGNARDLAVIGLGVGVVGFMAAYLSGGDFSLFNFAPDYGYSATESGYSVNAGGRLNFRKDGWHLYYAAGQENANGEFGDFRYESGGEYTADLWTAAFSETVQGETADYDFALSADYHGGIWQLSPTYRLHSRLGKDETETRNSLNLESVLRYNRWTISPSAGFRWESADEFGDNARFNLSAVRRF